MAKVVANSPQKVAILGGGIGALSTAFFLTDPSLQGRYEVTVHCMGWRLGGKGASGRNALIHQRIEEHGLHIWFGAYRNAITLMNACYKELGRAPDQPLATFAEAFQPQNRLVLTEPMDNEWRPWPIDFTPLPNFPDVPTIYGFYELIRGYIGRNPTVTQAIRSHRSGVASPRDHAILAALARRDLTTHEVNRAVSPERGLGIDESTAESSALKFLAQSIWAALGRRGVDNDRDRRFWIITYLGITIARGILDDQLYEKGFDAVDGDELREWLSRHSSFGQIDGARPDTLAFWSPVVQAFYDASFSYAYGDPTKPSIAASTGLRCLLRILFDFGGSIIYKMSAGMGDTVFVPLYECLKRRGVIFEFFNRVLNLNLDGSRRKIKTIEISRQVTVKRMYEPLICVRRLPCWPNEPLFNQLVEGKDLKASGANLEHWKSGWTDSGGRVTLDSDGDFDWVVLAISHAVLPAVAQELCNTSSRWEAMVHGMESVATQAWQLWFSRRRDELGMGSRPEIFGGFLPPWSSIVDFSQVLPFEDWNTIGAPKYLAYSCGTLPDQELSDSEHVEQRAKAFLQGDGKIFWPGAYTGGVFNWQALVASKADCGARLRQQLFRANGDPTARYVTARPGTRKLRISADRTGLENLTVAGEWADTGVNISSIEGTVISGMRASRKISGFPRTIPGETDA
jgi:uncharacterized protein with NAD-binding domain and iron-sulfur cluster